MQENRDKEIISLSIQNTQLQKNIDSSVPAEEAPSADALSEELVAARAEIGKLRSEATESTSTGEIAEGSQDGNVQQVDERIASIKADLEQKHAERVRQVEEQYQKRTDQMKTQLSTKLKEGRESIKQDAQKELEDAKQRLKESHAEEISRLRSEHQQELAQALSNSFNSNPSTEVKATGEKASKETPIEVKAEPQIATWPQSESGVKDFIANSPTAKGILRQNVLTKLNQEREAIATKVREEQEKVMVTRIEEVQKKADLAKEQAVIMESKRYSVKISMAENKARQAIAKIEVVEKAAKDTPQRPVVEVWAIAKDTKASPPQASTVSNPNSAAAAATSQNRTSTAATQSASSKIVTQGQSSSPQQPIQRSDAQNTQATAAQPSNQLAVKTNARKSSQTPIGNSVAATASMPTDAASQQTSPTNAHPLPIKPIQQSQQAQRAIVQKASAVGGALGPGAQGSSAIPRGGSGIARGGRGRGGIPTPQGQQPSKVAQATNPQAAAQQGQSSLSRGGGGRGRGGIVGQGRGQGRGQVMTQMGNAQQGHGLGSPGTGSPSTGRGINPAAKQFVPGVAKRTRDEVGDAGEGANVGKRARGGGNVG